MNAGEAVEQLGGAVNPMFTPNAKVVVDTEPAWEMESGPHVFEIKEIAYDGLGTFTVLLGGPDPYDDR